MKTFKYTFTIILSLILVLGTSSCFVVHETGNNGGHRGWHKNPKNPHHPNSTNPGHSKGKGKGKK